MVLVYGGGMVSIARATGEGASESGRARHASCGAQLARSATMMRLSICLSVLTHADV